MKLQRRIRTTWAWGIFDDARETLADAIATWRARRWLRGGWLNPDNLTFWGA